MEARDEGATVVESVVQLVLRSAPEVVPVVEMSPEDKLEVMALRQSEGPEQIALSTAPDASGVAPSSEWAMVQHRGTSDFSRNKQEEEEVWKAQYEVGS